MDIYYIVEERAGPAAKRLNIWGEAFRFSNGKVSVMERRTGLVTTYRADDLFGPGQEPGVFYWWLPDLLWIRITSVPDAQHDLDALVWEALTKPSPGLSLTALEAVARDREETRSA